METFGQFAGKPLTLVLSSKRKGLSAVQSVDGTVGFRIPTHHFLQELIKTVACPIVSTSANLSGHVCCFDVSAVVRQVGLEHISLVVDGGVLPSSLASTVVDATGKKAKVLREGVVSKGDLLPYL